MCPPLPVCRNVTHSPWAHSPLCPTICAVDLSARFGAALRRRRESLGISQEELAFRASLDRTYVSGIERGRRNPSLRIVGRLAAALGVPVEELFRTPDGVGAENEEPGLRPVEMRHGQSQPRVRFEEQVDTP